MRILYRFIQYKKKTEIKSMFKPIISVQIIVNVCFLLLPFLWLSFLLLYNFRVDSILCNQWQKEAIKLKRGKAWRCQKKSQCWCHYCWLVMSRCVCFLFVCLCFCACVYFWICLLECWISHFIWLLSELSDNVQGKLNPKKDFIFCLDECFLFFSSLKKCL